MRPTIQQLESFYWIARLGSIHAAARHQNLTQPAVTSRLRELEKIVGLELFDRSGYRLELKSSSDELLIHAEKILQLSDEFVNLQNHLDPARGLLRLGVNESTAMAGLSRLLTRIKSFYPNLKFELTVGVGATLSRRLNERELDIIISTNPISASHVVDEALGSTTMKWIASAKMPSPDKSFSQKNLAEMAILTLPPPSSLHTMTVDLLRSYNYRIDKLGSCNSIALILELVAAGQAVSFLPGSIVQTQIEHGLIQELPVNPGAPRMVYFTSYLQHLSQFTHNAILPIAKEVLIESGLLTPVLSG